MSISYRTILKNKTLADTLTDPGNTDNKARQIKAQSQEQDTSS